MLVLSRKKEEAIVIGAAIQVTVLAIKGNRVSLGIEAPGDVPVHRAEIHQLVCEFFDPDEPVLDQSVPSEVAPHTELAMNC